MSYRIKIPSKTAPPDEAQFLSGVERMWLLLQRRHREAVIAALILVLVGLAVAVAMWMEHRNAQAAHELERKANSLYLDRPVGKPAQAEENVSQAITLYRQVVDQYPRSPNAPVALFGLANALAHRNDLGGAIEAYQKFLDQYPDHIALIGIVLQRLGYAHLLNGDREKATQSFLKVLTIPGALNQDQALFELGKLEEAQARPEGALGHYQELMKSYPNSPFASEAAVRIKALEVRKGPEEGSAKEGAQVPGEQTPAGSPTP